MIIIRTYRKGIYNWFSGAKFYYDIQDHGVLGNIYAGLDEFESMSFLLHTMRRRDTFFDVGSNSGIYSILSAKVLKSMTYSYEPSAECFKRLSKNIELNNLKDKVFPNKIAVGNKKEKRKFTKSLNCIGRFVSESDLNIDYEDVEVTTLDHEVYSHNTDCFFIKIDVEGFESEVFKGGKESFKNNNCIAVIVEFCGNGKDFGYSEKDLFEEIKKCDFIPIKYDPFKREVSINTSFAFDGNIIFIKNFKAIQERIEKTKSFTIQGCKI
jgi:FkbM family methyltransferase